jgi:hypothetical protein
MEQPIKPKRAREPRSRSTQSSHVRRENQGVRATNQAIGGERTKSKEPPKDHDQHATQEVELETDARPSAVLLMRRRRSPRQQVHTSVSHRTSARQDNRERSVTTASPDSVSEPDAGTPERPDSSRVAERSTPRPVEPAKAGWQGWGRCKTGSGVDWKAYARPSEA